MTRRKSYSILELGVRAEFHGGRGRFFTVGRPPAGKVASDFIDSGLNYGGYEGAWVAGRM